MKHAPIKILIADDDAEDLELIESALISKQPSVSIHAVSNGRSVIDYLAGCPDEELPCLIILDYNMPELTGSEVLLIICGDNRYSKIPKVVMSTSSTLLYKHECISNGASAYYVKPNNMNDLTTLAVELLAWCKSD